MNRSLRTGVSRVPDTRKNLFQNVTSFGHKARTWLLSDQMEYPIMWVAEHHLDVTSAKQRRRGDCERRDTARFGHLPIRQDVEEPVGGTMALIKPHWKFQGIWKVMATLRNL